MSDFTPRLNSNGMENNPWWYSSGNIFYAAGYGLPNCTCYAYGRYAEIRGAFAALPGGNGGDWYNAATGFERGSTPALGAVICYTSRSGEYDGHVAVVEIIHEDGHLTTSNSAYGGRYFWVAEVYPENGYLETWMSTQRDYYCQGFIYNDMTPGPGPGPGPDPGSDFPYWILNYLKRQRKRRRG